MDRSRPTSNDCGTVRRGGIAGLVLVFWSLLAQPVAAHEGSAHAGTPHAVLLGVILLGGSIVGASVLFNRDRWSDRPRRTLAGVFTGAILAMLGTIALVEIQVEPLSTDATPIPRDVYPIVALAVGLTIVLGSIGIGLWRWPEKPAYIALGSMLGLWVAYPVLVGGVSYYHPLGYALALGVPAMVGYLLYRTVWPVLRELDPLARRTGIAAGLLFVVFFLFSTGQFTLNPDLGTSDISGSFFVFYEFANPLVMWPAIEFYVASIPMFGAISIGTILTFGLLGSLVATNTAMGTEIWLSDTPVSRSRGLLGGIATTGATACCCCAPAVYGIASAMIGISASPLYWAFLDPSSPIGALFFVGATAFMTGSAIRFSRKIDEAGICPVDIGGQKSTPTGSAERQ